MTRTDFFPIKNSESETEVTGEDFTITLFNGMKRWKDAGYLFPADVLLLFRLNQSDIPQCLLEETTRLAAVVYKGASDRQLREAARVALIMFASEPSRAAKEIMNATGTEPKIKPDASPELKKLVSILHKINSKFMTLLFPDDKSNPFLAMEKATYKSGVHGNKIALKGNKNALGKRWTQGKPKQQRPDPIRHEKDGSDPRIDPVAQEQLKQLQLDNHYDLSRVVNNGNEYNLDQFTERNKC